MARHIRWRFTVEKGAQSNFQSRSIKIAFARLQRYWAVTEVQNVNGPVDLTFTLSKGNEGTMWTNGNRIYIKATFRWGVSQAAVEQMAMCLCHEFGHYFSPGGIMHNGPGNLMTGQVSDPYFNWTQADMKWFGMLPWKSALRPWHEPKFWYPKPTFAQRFLGSRWLSKPEVLPEIHLGNCGQGPHSTHED